MTSDISIPHLLLRIDLHTFLHFLLSLNSVTFFTYNNITVVNINSDYLFLVSPITSSFNSAPTSTSSTKIPHQSDDLVPLGPPVIEHIGASGKVVVGADKGIKVNVPPQKILDGDDIKMQIQSFTPFTSSHFELPPDMKLVSPIYNLSVSTKLDGTVAEIEHYADIHNVEETTDMTILHTLDKFPPYHLTPMKGGVFSKNFSIATIRLNLKPFSHLAVGTQKGTCIMGIF